MKKLIAICMATIMLCCSMCVTSYAAENSDIEIDVVENRNSIQNAIYYTNDRDNTVYSEKENITTKSISNMSSKDIMESDIIIVDFDDLYDDTILAQEVSKQIKSGKIFYIRAKGYTANRSIIAQTLDIPDDAGLIREGTNESIIKRSGTFGYLVFVNGSGSLQIVRQLISTVDADIPVSNYNTNDVIEDMQINSESTEILSFEDVEFDFSDELDAVDSFLDAINPTTHTQSIVVDEDVLATQSVFTDYTYEIMYDTVYYYGTVDISSSETSYVRVGAITRCLYAERIYYNSSAVSDTSQISSKWGYMVDMWMQPTWNQSNYYRSLNHNLKVRFNTFPQGTGNGTYMMIFRDYTPTVDLSGETEATLSVGADAGYDNGFVAGGSAGFSVTTSFEDVEINVNKWQTGLSHSNNVVSWVYEIGHSLTRLTSNPVKTSTIKLPAGVVLWNYGSKASCIQLNFDAEWYVTQGFFNFDDRLMVASDAVVWRPSNLY